MFVMNPVGFSENEITNWLWYVENPRSRTNTWSFVSNKRLALEIRPEWKHRRIRVRVDLDDGTSLTRNSLQVLGAREFLSLGELQALRELDTKLRKSIQAYRSQVNELRTRIREQRELEGSADRLVEARKLEEQNKRIAHELTELSEELKGREQEIELIEIEKVRSFELKEEKLNKEKSAFEVMRRSFLQDQDLQSKLRAAEALLADVENAWDVFDKANHLKLKLSPISREQILELISRETDRARIERMRLLDSRSSQHSRCAIHGGGGAASAFHWGNICPDCSK